VRRFTPKYIFKKAVEERLPRAINHRRKRGFSVPVVSWTREGLKPPVEETPNEDKLPCSRLAAARES